jgi:hypothetical protein
MAKSKQRTVTGAYSDENFNDGSKDKIRNVDWGPFEGNSTPKNINATYIDTDDSVGSGPVGSGRNIGHKPRDFTD